MFEFSKNGNNKLIKKVRMFIKKNKDNEGCCIIHTTAREIKFIDEVIKVLKRIFNVHDIKEEG